VSYELEMLAAFVLGCCTPMLFILGVKILATLPWHSTKLSAKRSDEILKKLGELERQIGRSK
jgi:hypothetical protein